MAGEAANVPELRFPGFEGEWIPTSIGGFATFQRGFDLPSYKRKEGTIPIVSSGGITGFHDTAQVNGPGIVTGRYGSIGEIFLINEPHWPLNTALWVSDLHKNDIAFAYYFLSRINFKKLSDKTGVPGVNRNDLHKLKDHQPTLPEQQKIAAFLGTVDGKIGQLEKKKALLEDYKKGCMQKLFSRTLRFKDDNGNDFPDWAEKRLGDVASLKAGRFVTASDISGFQFAGSFPCYGANGLRGYVESFTHIGQFPLIGRQGALCGNVSIVSGQFHATEHAIVVDAGAIIEHDWIYYCLVQMALNQYATGLAQPGLSVGTLEDLSIWVPLQMEQQKIANFLTAIDDKITLTTTQLTQAQNFKKGLLQQMFV